MGESDWRWLAIGAGLLGLALALSAATEMGTRWPRRRRRSPRQEPDRGDRQG